MQFLQNLHLKSIEQSKEWIGSKRVVSDSNLSYKSAEITEQIAIEFAEWIFRTMDSSMLYQKTKKQLFQEFLKSKQ